MKKIVFAVAMATLLISIAPSAVSAEGGGPGDITAGTCCPKRMDLCVIDGQSWDNRYYQKSGPCDEVIW